MNMASNKKICHKVYADCNHECGASIIPSEGHTCPIICQQRVPLTIFGRRVIRKCGDVEGVKVLASAKLENAAPSGQENECKEELDQMSCPKKLSPLAPGVSWNELAVGTPNPFPVLHLKSPVPEATDPIPGPSTLLGRAQAHFESSDSPSALDDLLLQLWSEFPDIFGAVLDDIVADLHTMEVIDVEDDGWKLGLAKCSSGHLYPGNLQFCGICGDVNQFFYEEE